MIRLGKRRHGPIGVDIGARSIKLVQLTADRSAIVDTARWEWAPLEEGDDEAKRRHLVEALRNAHEGRAFRGRDAVLCLSDQQLFLQNLRVPKAEGAELEGAVMREAAKRIPHPIEETDIRFWEAADIRQGEAVMREVIVFACHRPEILKLVDGAREAGLRPIAVDVQPAALLRSLAAQFRRDDEREQRTLIVHIGYSVTGILIAQDDEALFIKYIDFGGRHLDQAVSRALETPLAQANALRREPEGDGESDIARSVAEAQQPAAERLVKEVAMCVRYHSVTFRGKPIERLLIGGGEASRFLVDLFSQRLAIEAHLSDPFRRIAAERRRTRTGSWDIAAGLALRDPLSRSDA